MNNQTYPAVGVILLFNLVTVKAQFEVDLPEVPSPTVTVYLAPPYTDDPLEDIDSDGSFENPFHNFRNALTHMISFLMTLFTLL